MIRKMHIQRMEGSANQMDRRVFLKSGISTIALSRMAKALPRQTLQVQSAKLIGGATKIPDRDSSAGYLVALTEPGHGVTFTGLPAGSKLAIRYASLSVGTISVAVNDQPACKVNIHSSGALTSSYLDAIVDLTIPANATVTISLAPDDVGVNIDRIVVGDELGLPPDIWNLPPLPIASGPCSPDWKALSRIYTVPAWWREAKFGAWSHWDPQSMPEDGDWYARGMYMEGSPQYEFHLKHFGHPSEYGYKDICHNWVIDRWNPEQLMSLYVEMGARYFMAMGCHHDNFDCFDSKYQPWNSVHVGPKVDIVGTWEKVARRHGMRFGIGFHDTPARTWGQFMPVRYTSDKTGPMKGVPYDALQTVLDGKGEWWDGMDPVDLLWSAAHHHHACAARSGQRSVAFTLRQPVYVAGGRRHHQVSSRRDLLRRARRRFAGGHGRAHGPGISRSAADRELLQQIPAMEPWEIGSGRQPQGRGWTLQQLPGPP